MRPIATLCILLIALPVWAGTFRDDFEDGNLDGWKMVSGLGGWRIDIEDRFSIMEGILRIDAMNKTDSEADLCIMGDGWEDYSFSADMRIMQVEQGDWAGGAIASRWEDWGGFEDYVLFGAVANGWNARCNTTQNGNLATAWNQQLAIASEAGEWHRPEIRAVGNEISFYIDGKLYHKQNDTLHPSGGVSLVALDAIVEFDNVIIEGPDIPDAGPSGYYITSSGKLATTWGEIRRAE